MKLKIKDIFIMILVFVTSYAAIPLIFLNFYSGDNALKLAFAILLITAFLSFASNLIYTYIRGFYIYIPILSIICSCLLFTIFNNSVLLVIIIVSILSFFGTFIGNIFTIKNKKEIS